MGFDDVARRMRERHAGHLGGDMPPTGASVEQMQDAASRAERRSQAVGDIVLGGLLLGLGLLITVITYDSASRQGGTYVVAYGPVVFGFIKLIRGFVRLGG